MCVGTSIKLMPTLLLVSLLLFPMRAQDRGTSEFDSPILEIPVVTKTNQRPITSMDLVTIRDVTGLQISPDGKSVAYVVSQAVYETNSYRTALFVVGTVPGSVPVNLGSAGSPQWTSVGEYHRVSPQWSPDGRHITYIIKLGDRQQIWRWPPEGGDPEQLTHNTDDVDSYEWQPDGRRIIFSTVAPVSAEEINRVSEQGILYDSYTGEGPTGSIRAWENRPIARAAIAMKPRKIQTWVYDLAARAQRKATTEEEATYNKTHLAPSVFQPGDKLLNYIVSASNDGKFVAVASLLMDPEKSSRHTYAVFVRSSGGGESVELVPPSELSIDSLRWSSDDKEIYFARSTENGGTALYAVPARGGVMREVTKSNDVLTRFSFDKGMSRVACLRENATTPPEVAVFDLKDGVPRTLAVVNPEFQNIFLSPVTKLEWTNKYGDKSFGYLVKPFNYEPGKRYPLIVTTYRAGGFLRGAVGDEYPIQVLAANGFAVLAFDAPRDPVPKPGDFRTLMLRWYSPLASLEAATKMLDEMGIIDRRRKGLTGLSYGSEITCFTITHSDLFQAAAASSASARDPILYYLANNYIRRILKQWGLGGLPDAAAAARWQELSPAINAARVKAPLLIQAADSEYLYGLQFYTALREHHKPVEFIIYADEGHIKNQPKHKYEVYQRNLDWFNFWLQGKEDPDPAKAEQYVRWRDFRKLQLKSQAQLSPKQMKMN
jgi:dipeptidyl aminopeptidase/acylaminoacyl peptidase